MYTPHLFSFNYNNNLRVQRGTDVQKNNIIYINYYKDNVNENELCTNA